MNSIASPTAWSPSCCNRSFPFIARSSRAKRQCGPPPRRIVSRAGCCAAGRPHAAEPSEPIDSCPTTERGGTMRSVGPGPGRCGLWHGGADRAHPGCLRPRVRRRDRPLRCFHLHRRGARQDQGRVVGEDGHPDGIAVAARQAASGYALRALSRRKTYTTPWDISTAKLRPTVTAPRLDSTDYGCLTVELKKGLARRR